MDTHVDWLSWTTAGQGDVLTHEDLYYRAKALLLIESEAHNAYIFDGTGFDPCPARAPYRTGLQRSDRGCRIYGGGHVSNVLFELTGRACEGIRQFDAAAGFIAPLAERLTRLDVAVDIRSDTRPAVFGNDRSHRAFRSISYISSDTGETIYVGSPKSDRFCRVYRYNPPHPRSKLLRVEFVFRRGLAKAAARSLLDAGSFGRFIGAAGNTYGFIHPDWSIGEITDERLRVPVLTREDADTIAWLYKAVLPAIKRVYASGALDLDDFLKGVIMRDE